MPRIEHVPLQKLRAVHLNRRYRDLLKSGSRPGGGLSARTVRYIHAILRKALNDAVKWDLLEANPALRAEPPEANRPVVRVWSPSELRTFLAYVETDRWFPAWLMAASTGARRDPGSALERPAARPRDRRTSNGDHQHPDRRQERSEEVDAKDGEG